MIRAEEFCKRVFDGTHETPKASENGYKLLTSKNILDGFLDKSNAYYISEEDYNSINKRSGVQTWDILFSMIGTVGNVCLIHDSKIDFAIKNMGVFSCEDEWKAKWLYFYFQSPYAKSVIKNYLNGAVQKFLPLEVLRDFPVPQFDYNKEHITKFLWSVERRLSLNRNTNATLEAMAKTLYDYWFVQFDFPDEKGRPYKTSGGKMVYNEELGREIPAGWEVKQLKDLCSFSNGINYDKDEVGDKTYHIINVRNITASSVLLDDNDFDEITLKSSQADRFLVSDNDILVARSGTPGATRLLMNNDGNTIFCGFIIRCVPNDVALRYYLTYALKRLEGTQATKTGGSILQNVSQDTLESVVVVLPDDDILPIFSKKIDVYHSMMQSLIEENHRLFTLRDWLLPMLMNGQVGFKGDKEVE